MVIISINSGDDFTSFFEPISGTLVNNTSEYINGNIVIINGLGKSKFWFRMVELKNLGAIAVIHITGDSKF
jgi:hypothetical protein